MLRPLLDMRAAMVLTSVAMMTIEGDAGMSKVTRTEGWHAALQGCRATANVVQRAVQVLGRTWHLT
jgi:hypothetical protein